MAFERPTLSAIIDRIKKDFKNGLDLQAILRRSFLGVFATGFGGASHTLHGHIDFGISKKFFPDTGDEETVVRWGSLYNLPQKDATFTELVIDVTGTTGGTLPIDKVYVRSDSVEFKVKTEVIVPALTTVQATIVAVVEGDESNMDDGDEISLQSAIPGINSTAVVDSTAIEGEELEELEDYRVRVLERLAFPPSGGTANDYIAFAKTVAGITRAWLLPGNRGEGSADTTFVEDGNAPASIIPSPAKVDEVQLAVDDLKPVTADHIAFAPTELEMNPQIQLKPNTTAVQNAVIDELNDLLAREAEVRGAIDPNKVGLGVTFTGIIKISQIGEAISIAAGEEDHVVLSPTANVQPPQGGIVTLGTPVFSTLA